MTRRATLGLMTLLCASLGVALLVAHQAGFGMAPPDLFYGWGIAASVLVLAHLYLRFIRSARRIPLIVGALGLIFGRLLVLLVVIIVVLFAQLFRPGPFLAGLLSAYFAGIWWEVAWFSTHDNEIT